jgi:hypothetical protein
MHSAPAGFETGIFCSGGGRNGHYATPRHATSRHVTPGQYFSKDFFSYKEQNTLLSSKNGELGSKNDVSFTEQLFRNFNHLKK